MTEQPKPPFAADPNYTWACEKCGATAPGPEYPGYEPWCPICELPLVATPIAPPAPVPQ